MEREKKSPCSEWNKDLFSLNGLQWKKLLLVDPAGNNDPLVYVNKLNEIHSTRKIAHVILFSLYGFKIFHLTAYQIVNPDLLHLLTIRNADIISGGIGKHFNVQAPVIGLGQMSVICVPVLGKSG